MGGDDRKVEHQVELKTDLLYVTIIVCNLEFKKRKGLQISLVEIADLFLCNPESMFFNQLENYLQTIASVYMY